MRIWQIITNFGVDKNIERSLGLRSRMTNRIIFIFLLTEILVVIPYIIDSFEWKIPFVGFSTSLLLLAPIFLNKFLRQKYVDIIYMILLYFVTMILVFIAGERINLHIGLMLIPIGVRITLKEDKAVFISVVISLICLCICLFIYDNFEPLMYHPLPFFTSFLTLFSIGFCCFILFEHYLNEVKYKEKLIVERNERLREIAGDMSSQNVKLKNAKYNLEKANKKLKDGINKRLRVEKELKSANAYLSQFASIVSHDLKEPLRTLNNFSGLLARNMQDEENESSIEYLSFISDAASRMTIMIDDLITYSKVGAKVEESSSINLNSVVPVVLNNLQVLIKSTNARIEIVELPIIFGQFTHFVQLFHNIICNSLTFVEEGKVPIIQISAESFDSECLISIQDNGIGMESAYLTKIFNPFSRLHSRDKYKGAGIGLATCKKIVERYNGRIWATSEPNQGSCFFIHLPIIPTKEKISKEPLTSEDFKRHCLESEEK